MFALEGKKCAHERIEASPDDVCLSPWSQRHTPSSTTKTAHTALLTVLCRLSQAIVVNQNGNMLPGRRIEAGSLEGTTKMTTTWWVPQMKHERGTNDVPISGCRGEATGRVACRGRRTHSGTTTTTTTAAAVLYRVASEYGVNLTSASAAHRRRHAASTSSPSVDVVNSRRRRRFKRARLHEVGAILWHRRVFAPSDESFRARRRVYCGDLCRQRAQWFVYRQTDSSPQRATTVG